MSTVYLFRVDGAKDNDEFFTALRSSASHVYAGVDFRVGASGWIPDLVKVVVEEPPNTCSLTLIELEATESVALNSCRKYLPENSDEIVHAFSDYLDRVIRNCRSHADPREREFVGLKGTLSGAEHVTVKTAGALRTQTRFVEELPLLDQPKRIVTTRPVQENHQEENYHLHGVLRLSSNEAKVLARCVMVLDAIVRGFDHSAATFKNWRGQDRSQPLKYLLKKNDKVYPTLRSFILATGTGTRGVTLDFELVLSEVVEIWSSAVNKPLDRERIRVLMSRYYPVAHNIKSHEQMAGIFETARKHVSEDAI